MAEEEVQKAAVRMICGLCKEDIQDSDDYITSRCTDKECLSDLNCHSECIETYLSRQVATSQTAAQQKHKNKVTHAPHAALKSQPCPREGCRGRVKKVERVTQTKRKKELEAILDAPPAIPVPTPKPSGRGRKAHQAPAASQVASGSKARSPSPPPPVLRRKPQLNVPAKGEFKQASVLSHVPARLKTGRNLHNSPNRFGTLATLDEDEEEEDAGSVASLALTDEDFSGPSIEEIDAAVREGILPEDYRSQWCKDFFDKKDCSRGVHCPFAHNLQQLRIDAAIKKGTIREDFKLNFCADEHQKGYCGYGLRCQHAHSAEELRILKLMDQDLLDDEYHITFCSEFLRDGECRAGIACASAHSRSELRAEAAVLHEKKNKDYRFRLCESFYRTGQCSKGVLCDDAHGIDEVRVCSAVHFGELTASFKTQRCTRDRCEAPWKCHYYHSQKDRRRRIARKTTYCPVFQELGSCGLQSKCYWAHGTDDLDTKAFSFNFPLVTANQHGDWGRVGKKPLAVRTSKGKQAAWQGASTSAWVAAQHPRGSPLAGHQAAFHPKATGVENILAVQLNKMPAQPGDNHRKRRSRQHRGGGGGKGGGSEPPAHFKLCNEFKAKGHCTAVDCAFAHGKDMLDSRIQQQEGNHLNPAQRQKALNPETARLSDAVLFHLKKHKVEQCVEKLKTMGLSLSEAQEAAKLMGGDAENAVLWHLEKAFRLRPKHNAEVNVSGEAMSVLYSAYEKGWSLQMLEQQIKQKGGNPSALFPEQATAEEEASCSGTPRSEASTWESLGSSTPRTPWQEAAVMQRDAIGNTVKLDEHGFPDVTALHLGDVDQNVLRYEGLQAMYREKQQEAEQQQQQSSSTAKTPFADARPQLDDRPVDREAAAAKSLAAMGVRPSVNVFGAGPSHAPAQPQGTFAAMAPQGSVQPPPPYQATRTPPGKPPPAVNAYGQPIPAEPARPPSVNPFTGGGHPSAAGRANGVASHQAARPAQPRLSPQQSVPAAGNWQKEMWEKDVNTHAADYHWIHQQHHSQKQGGDAASSGYRKHPQRDYEQMPAITAQHAAPRQMAAAAPAPAATKPSSFAPKEFDLDDFVADAFC